MSEKKSFDATVDEVLKGTLGGTGGSFEEAAKGFFGEDEEPKSEEKERGRHAFVPLDAKTISTIISFFEEFFSVKSSRFIDTLQRAIKEGGLSGAKAYCKGYAEVPDRPTAPSLLAKMESKEFELMVHDISRFDVAPENMAVNQRFEIYYGEPGGGKTYAASRLCEGRVMPVSSSTTADDLFLTFEFVDGKPTFKKSLLVRCAEAGRPICLDEINSLNQDVQISLQTLLDGKKEFFYKDRSFSIVDASDCFKAEEALKRGEKPLIDASAQTVTVGGVTFRWKPAGTKPLVIGTGFKVYGTMNLDVGGRTWPLTPALADRARRIVEFTPTAESLAERLPKPNVEEWQDPDAEKQPDKAEAESDEAEDKEPLLPF